ncbi:hypothetical protein [Azospirillum canadense]|uniref:hypothetical protein n=1 Tax=Azospirillum canadense TaxID=403962 RepID=UPI00222772E6|nr:hypothetical protein [Azospirillum canadense]MCW2240560.1 hypothetical protein [Azospirillum canadense]
MPLLARSANLGLILLVMGMIAGCAPDRAYRSAALDPAVNGADWPTCAQCRGDASLEHRTYVTKDRVKGDYLLGFVEFDDQGWYHDIRQKQLLLSRLKAMDADQGEKFLIIVYAHGWKHNARADDPDVSEFQKLLERIDVMEGARAAAGAGSPEIKRRKIVGVYMGWRGNSISLPLLQEATFWTRKNAAERVGSAGAKDLLPELKNFKRVSNKDRGNDDLGGPNETQLIVVGHSFGGYLVYTALHSQILERATRLRIDGEEAYYGIAQSFGDFVLLVNPAFEGSIYEPIHNFAVNRCYSPKQRPVMMIVTSEGDWATGIAFPIGRLYTFTQSAPQDGERETVLKAVGHLNRYRTHHLRIQRTENDQPVSEPKTVIPTNEKRAEAMADAATAEMNRQTGGAISKTSVYYGNAYLEPARPLRANYPYLVATAEKAVIRDHNDIFNENFIDFIVRFMTAEVVSPKKNEPPDEPSDYPGCARFLSSAPPVK